MKRNPEVTVVKNTKWIQFILALLDYPSLEAAADAVGIGKVTAWRWLKDSDILARYREARRDAMQHAVAGPGGRRPIGGNFGRTATQR
jgi:hypothetical protein